MITHRTNILTQLDRLLVMNNGTISMYGPREQVMAELSKQHAQKASQVVAGAAPAVI